MYAKVIVDNPSPLVDMPFHYLIPDRLKVEIGKGSRVAVPFGSSNRSVEGFVIGLSEGCPDHVKKVKPILKKMDSVQVLFEETIDLAKWMRDEYLCTWLEAIGCIVPSYIKSFNGTRKQGKYRLWMRRVHNEIEKPLPKNAARMRAVMSFLDIVSLNEICCGTLMEETGCSLQTLRALERRGFLEIYDKRIIRTPEFTGGLIQDRVKRLSDAQNKALETIRDMHREGTNEVLLHGITGSGKTEVYLRLIGDTLKAGRKAIVLVPEISLTPQMVEWYYKRFGDRAALIHSRLSDGERYDQWEGIIKGRYDVAIGARSAVFAPFDDIGLIIIDEEHEHTYKSESSPRYITCNVAAKRCEHHGGLLVLGSATPSIETYHRALKGEIGLVQLKERVGGGTLPRVEVVDMREELKEGNRSVFSKKLTREMADVLQKRQQGILFLNRRGYSIVVSCRNCGSVVKCKKCDISLTYHRNENSLVCHYCGYRRRPPARCEVCGSDKIRHLGSGTEKLEKAVEQSFPGVRVLRMDMDTTRKKGSHYEILKKFKNHEADILLGTQMVTKGLDFTGVTLVGVVLADFSLNLPDFRAAERTFQLLAQVSGRAGRGVNPGKVVIQTYNPGHYSIAAAKFHDYKGFFEQEIEIRKRFGYPPYGRLVNIIISGEEQREVAHGANILYNDLKEALECQKGRQYELFGPSQAIYSRIKNRYRWQIIIKAPILEGITEKVRSVRLELLKGPLRGLNVIVDVDPLNLS